MSKAYESDPAFYEQAGKTIGEAKTMSELLKGLKEQNFPVKEGEKVLQALDSLMGKGGLKTFPRSQEIEISGKKNTVIYSISRAISNVTVKIQVFSLEFHNEYKGAHQDLDSGVGAERAWDFSQSATGERYVVNSITEVRTELEGKGIGMALTLASNVVVNDVISRDLLGNAESVNVCIQDASKSLVGGRQRGQWTTNVAKTLGFTPSRPGSILFYREFEIKKNEKKTLSSMLLNLLSLNQKEKQ